MSKALCIIAQNMDTLFAGGIEYEAKIFDLQALRQYRGYDP